MRRAVARSEAGRTIATVAALKPCGSAKSGEKNDAAATRGAANAACATRLLVPSARVMLSLHAGGAVCIRYDLDARTAGGNSDPARRPANTLSPIAICARDTTSEPDPPTSSAPPSALPAFLRIARTTAGANSTLVRSISKSRTVSGTSIRSRDDATKPATATAPATAFSSPGVPRSSSISTSAREALPAPTTHISARSGFSSTTGFDSEIEPSAMRACIHAARPSAAAQLAATATVKKTRWSKWLQNGFNTRFALVSLSAAMESSSSSLASDARPPSLRRFSFRRADAFWLWTRAKRARALSASVSGIR
mmetsp:Transcript_11305/g.47416  ORF Transcript_11305/g.47416 Transcript_11305/m.47416 type:complete len:310 (+) Transcript_11305:901-1830(+)